MLALLLAALPDIIVAAQDVTAVVNGAKAAGSVISYFETLQQKSPGVAGLVQQLGQLLPAGGATLVVHLESITQAILGVAAWPAHMQEWFSANGDEAMKLQPGMGRDY